VEPFLSIVTASLNNADSLSKTIDSIQKQSFLDIEHIVIDGGSTDATLEILQNTNTIYNFLWRSEADNGIADAMNKGVKLSRGKYILFLHADDYLLGRHSIETATSYLRDECYDIYSAPVLLEYVDGRRVLRKPYPVLFWYHFKTPFCHQGALVHRRVFDKVGLFYNEFSIAMDYDFFYRALKENPRILYQKEPLAIMGAYGVGTRRGTVIKRIEEEYKVQYLNETSRFWKMMQFLYHAVHRSYKFQTAKRP